MTPASDGPSRFTPVRGFTTLPPFTSWSYWRIRYSLAANVQAAEHGLEEFRLIHAAVFDAGVGVHGASHTALSWYWGTPSCMNSMSRWVTSLPL